jgi:hypothetical protein
VPLRVMFDVSTHQAGALLVLHAPGDLPHALVEWVIMLIVTHERVTAVASSRRTSALNTPWCTCAARQPCVTDYSGSCMLSSCVAAEGGPPSERSVL